MNARMRGPRFIALTAIALMLALPASGKDKKADLIFVSPDFANRRIESVALLPAASFDNRLDHEKLAEDMFAQVVRPAGYRWLTSSVARDLLKSSAPNDSIYKAVRAAVLKNVRVDSLSAGPVCALLRTDALLTLRVDRFDQLQMEWDQAGKPSTTVQLKAALVDSSGRLLWSASGSETGEGPYHDPSAGTLGMSSSGLSQRPVTGQGGAPSFEEVLTKLTTRWGQSFPAKRAPAPPPATN
jgi:hypothetical protein